MNILHIVGARPNFMKAAPVLLALRPNPRIQQRLVHTGQHYDERMSDIFFHQLGLPKPDVNLEVGSGSHALQTAEIMIRFEKVLLENKPDWLFVYGDVNSTIACALVAAKLGVKIAHVEAGLRSGDRSMPEEINRVLTDQISDLFFTPSTDGDENLQREGIPAEKIHFVGNCMIDTLVRLLDQARRPELPGLDQPYALVTLHRPSNVDDPDRLEQIHQTLLTLSHDLPIIFPIHPRTQRQISNLKSPPTSDLRPPTSDLHLVPPQGYLEFLWLQQHATLILTDSGGIQEEATYLRVPCLTMRENTERPVTCTLGSNLLVGQDMERVKTEARRILAGQFKPVAIPPLWDGRAGERIAAIMSKFISS